MNSLRASIDIGSNSILLLIGEFLDGAYNEIANESNVTALGRDLDKTGYFHIESMESSFHVLKQYSEIAKTHGVKAEDIIATATEASRVASNAKDFFLNVKKETGIDVKIITSDAEAYYSTKGITFNTDFEEDEICVMDIGGASTELIKLSTKSNKIIKDFSMPIGAVRVTNWIEEGSCESRLNKILTEYSKSLSEIKCKKLYCVAGTMTSVGNMYLGLKAFTENKIHGLEIDAKSIFKMLDNYANFSKEDYLEKFPFLGKRAITIYGGLIVGTTILRELGVEIVEISTYGLRYGTLEEGKILDEHIVR